jgi:hypothetical protein
MAQGDARRKPLGLDRPQDRQRVVTVWSDTDLVKLRAMRMAESVCRAERVVRTGVTHARRRYVVPLPAELVIGHQDQRVAGSGPDSIAWMRSTRWSLPFGSLV